MTENFQLYAELEHWLYGIALSSARLFPTFILLPYLSSATVRDVFKYPLILCLGAALWPLNGEVLRELDVITWGGLLIKELLTGLIMAICLSFPFWVMHAVGSYIDNQRGATLSSSINPQSGLDSSDLAVLFNMLAVVLLLEAGGMTIWLDVMFRSYQLWPPADWSLPALDPIVTFLSHMMVQAVRLASPVITVFLLTEVLLGLMSRYTPQMNAFSMALTVKSVVGFFVLLLYLSPVIPQEVIHLSRFFPY